LLSKNPLFIIRAMTGDMHICDYNTRLKCPLKQGSCPFLDSNFIRDLELFLYRNRTPRSCSLRTSESGHFGRGLFFSDFYLARRAMVFGDDFVQEYAVFDLTGKISMTKRKCRHWIRVRTRWKIYYRKNRISKLDK